MASVTIALDIRDAKTNERVSLNGIKIWVNNQLVASGTPQFQWQTDKQAWVWVKGDAFESTSSVGVIANQKYANGTMTQDVYVAVAQSQPKTGTLVIQTVPQPVPNAMLIISDASGAQAASTGDDGKVSVSGVTLGSCQIMGTCAGYDDGSATVDFAKEGQVVTLNLVKTKAGGEDGKGSPDPNAKDAPAAAGALAATTSNSITAARDSSEDIYGANDFSAYFTSVNVRLYIGNLFIDEMQSIQYVLQSNAVPQFGYCSRFADAYAEGRALVQGQLVLNYISEGYLYTVLDEYARRDAAPDNSAGKKLVQALTASQQFRSSKQDAGLFDDTIAALTADPAAVKQAKKQMAAKRRKDVYINACSQPAVVDMVVEIGGGANRTYRKLEAVKFTSNEQVVDQSGEVIAEAYGFIARRLR